MKIKCRPEDFRVEERPLVKPGATGAYTLYRLTKRGLGTIEAMQAVRRRWNVPPQRVQYAGLKDRHAETIQYVSIEGGPNRSLSETHFTIEPLGKLAHHYGPAHFSGNRFAIVLRHLSPAELGRARRAAVQLPTDGLPNYFDDQRFGSVGYSGGFIAEAWLKGDHETALKMALAEPTASDRPDEKRLKAIVQANWGHWPETKAQLTKSHTRSIVTYLVDHPDDFRGAFARLDRNLRSLYFSAFQSHLWNQLLARMIEQIAAPEQRFVVAFKAAALPFHQGLRPEQVTELKSTQVPMPSARNPLPEGPLRDAIDTVLTAHGLTWDQLRVRHLKDVFLSKGARPALFFPDSFQHAEAPDDLYPGRTKMMLTFDLPKGAYATLVVKRLTEPTKGAS